MKALDYSSYHPPPEQIAAEGYRIVVRYVSRDAWKRIERPEADALLSAGLCIALVFEDYAQRPLEGYRAGEQDATVANAQADALGCPSNVAIFYAIDFDADHEQLVGPCAAYLDGAADNSRRPVGVYGHYGAVETLGPHYTPWQCAAWSGKGTGTGGSVRCLDGTDRRRSTHAVMFQDVAGAPPWAPTQTDLNHVFDTTGAIWCWPDPTHQLRKALAMKATSADDLEGQYLFFLDGWGYARRYHIPSPPAVWALMRQGVIDQNPDGTPATCHLTGDEAAWFRGLPEENKDWPSDVGQLFLAGGVINPHTTARTETINEGLDAVRDQLAEHDAADPGDDELVASGLDVAEAAGLIDDSPAPAWPPEPHMDMHVDTPDT